MQRMDTDRRIYFRRTNRGLSNAIGMQVGRHPYLIEQKQQYWPLWKLIMRSAQPSNASQAQPSRSRPTWRRNGNGIGCLPDLVRKKRKENPSPFHLAIVPSIVFFFFFFYPA